VAENPRIEELRRRVQLDPASIAFAALAEEFRRMGRHDDAIETCRAGLQRHPAYLSARVTLGRALIETGDYAAAREELETVLRSAPENLAAIRGLAQIHERLGHSTEMDPQLAAMMNAEVERVALVAEQARAAVAPEEPKPEPVQAFVPIAVAAPAVPVARFEPVESAAPLAPFEPVGPVGPVEPVESGEPEEADDPVFAPAADMLAMLTLARLERFLVAIDTARHP
jgi:tetratricopeptide (TPR) repeat protein